MDNDGVESILDIFDLAYERKALIIKPVETEILPQCQKDLAEIGAPFMPADYIEFLQLANGFAWNGFEYFGTYVVTVKKSGYVLQSIITMNAKWYTRKMDLKGKLLLGKFDDDLFIYDAADKKYKAVDSLTLIEIISFDSFDEMFVHTVGEYIYFDGDDDEDTDED